MVPCKSTAKEVSFEWSHHRISYTDSKVRTTLHVFIIDSGAKGVKCKFGISFINLYIYPVMHFLGKERRIWRCNGRDGKRSRLG